MWDKQKLREFVSRMSLTGMLRGVHQVEGKLCQGKFEFSHTQINEEHQKC